MRWLTEGPKLPGSEAGGHLQRVCSHGCRRRPSQREVQRWQRRHANTGERITMVSVGPRANRLPRESQNVLKSKEEEREIPVERLGHLPTRRSAKSATRRARAILRPSASKGSSWAETKTKSGGPRLRDAQGQEIKHESRYRKVRRCCSPTAWKKERWSTSPKNGCGDGAKYLAR